MADQENTLERVRQLRRNCEAMRADIQRQVSELLERQSQLEVEDRELEITERTLLTRVLLAAPACGPQQLVGAVANVVSGLEPEIKKPPRKPDDVPPILEMADVAFAQLEAQGIGWATSPQIAEVIRRLWWPEVRSEYIQPQLWRAAKRGDLLKEGNRYARKSARYEEGPDTEVTRPLQSNGVGIINA